jgi:GxxExxY protein
MQSNEVIDGVVKEEYDLAGQIIGLAMKVHRTLGPGFLEGVYHQALLIELNRAGIPAESEKPLRVLYDGISVGEFKADIVIEGQLIVEVKAVQSLATAHEVQLVNYLTATHIDGGLLLNFGSNKLEFRRKFREYKTKA